MTLLLLSLIYRRFEQKKQQRYEQRICEVKMGLFTPFGFFYFWGEWVVWLQRIAALLAKREQPHSLVMSWLRCSISFYLLRSAYVELVPSMAALHMWWFEHLTSMGSKHIHLVIDCSAACFSAFHIVVPTNTEICYLHVTTQLDKMRKKTLPWFWSAIFFVEVCVASEAMLWWWSYRLALLFT